MAGKEKASCSKCGQLCNTSQIKRHEDACDGVRKEVVKTVFTGFCKFCGKECKNHNSQRNHERCCPKNESRKYVNYKIGKKGGNQYTKAKELGMPIPSLSKESRARMSTLAKNRICSNEAREKLSIAAKKNGLGGHTSKYHLAYKGCVLHSSYEIKVAESLDSCNINWTRPKPLMWVDGWNKSHRYYPDFYLPDYSVYLDPKNDYLINNINPKFGITDIEKIDKVMEQNGVRVLVLNKNQLTWDIIKLLI